MQRWGEGCAERKNTRTGPDRIEDRSAYREFSIAALAPPANHSVGDAGKSPVSDSDKGRVSDKSLVSDTSKSPVSDTGKGPVSDTGKGPVSER